MSERNLSSAQFVQLPLLMTPDEIKSQYSPLDGDRHVMHRDTGDPLAPKTSPDWTPHLKGASAVRATGRKDPVMLESANEVWGRKKAEAFGTWSKSNDKFMETHNHTLGQDIERNGVENPVALQDPTVARSRLTGLPQVLGGHHRVAAARSDSWVPVTHHDDFWAARDERRGSY